QPVQPHSALRHTAGLFVGAIEEQILRKQQQFLLVFEIVAQHTRCIAHFPSDIRQAGFRQTEPEEYGAGRFSDLRSLRFVVTLDPTARHAGPRIRQRSWRNKRFSATPCPTVKLACTSWAVTSRLQYSRPAAGPDPRATPPNQGRPTPQ